ncbi:MAG TPA: hypothetical protein VFE02_07455 [Candidatus Acidoferrales bacterium]|jgi:hypothetical protein|nr:hypothetical protein [Candidatus Acidoferrales bacterium]
MKHLYEIFEQFPDKSSLWRESAVGTKKAQRKLKEMVRKFSNPIYVLDLTTGEVVRMRALPDQNSDSAALIGEFKKKMQPFQIH